MQHTGAKHKVKKQGALQHVNDPGTHTAGGVAWIVVGGAAVVEHCVANALEGAASAGERSTRAHNSDGVGRRAVVGRVLLASRCDSSTGDEWPCCCGPHNNAERGVAARSDGAIDGAGDRGVAACHAACSEARARRLWMQKTVKPNILANITIQPKPYANC